ncbi:fused MFS/spermidine synthase [Longimicrobium sp.]|uniref:spermidine synthase n=1 Tax=Longimicrobium sp. TaxID=2029185 RepID=UPI002CF61C01|nr:fused MFS/spermidine synthase [Longimicrobium sp.]HSU12502.1 fused MFS/spermidine synthase [Longimicrobium sp.]
MSQQTPVAATVHAAHTPAAAPPPRAAHRWVLVVFTASIFTSAFLLFLVQPMFSRFVLPLLGGTPAVWNTCMLFFQAALLGGYLYAHVGAQKLGVRRQAAVHVVLLAVAALLLPISVAGAAPRGGQEPIAWLLLLMLTTVGLPFLVLSATGPMLQKWFAETGHPRAANPYWLYAASNLGSMLALLGYPFLMEPRLRLMEQSRAWAVGYGVLAVLVVLSAVALWRLSPAADPASTVPAGAGASIDAAATTPVAARERLIWIGLAAIPSSLLLSVTTFITTDVAPVPLLWVVPLAIYLLSFTLAFAARPPLKHKWMLAAEPFFIAAVSLLLMYGFTRRPMQVIPMHLLALFVVAMVCHGELARRRPSVSHLTEFYLWIAVGGVLGGIFNVLVAPLVFTRTWEYPVVLTLACLARPWPTAPRTNRQMLMNLLRTAAFVFALLLVSRQDVPGIPPGLQLPLAAAVMALVSAGLGRAPLWLALCIGTSLVIRTAFVLKSEPTLLAHRSFYGRFAVLNAPEMGGFHTLYHGSTLHGAQSMDPARRREPLTYYARGGPLGQLFAAKAPEDGRRRVAVVGLGTGTLAAYSNAGEDWTFYEIDPGILKMASDRRYFTYLSDSPARMRVVLGDARLSMAHAPPHGYDMILVDAFNSDAIPVHLLTREALGVYLDKLAPGGIIMLHLSNRYLELESVVAALAKDRGVAARIGETNLRGFYISASSWAGVARSDADFGVLRTEWRPAVNRRHVAPWTDDFSSILSVWGK